MDIVSIKEKWEVVYRKLQKILGRAASDSWIRPLCIIAVENDTIYISAASVFLRDWVSNNYLDTIKSVIAEIIPEIKNVEIVVVSNKIVENADDTVISSDNNENYQQIHSLINQKNVNNNGFTQKSKDDVFEFDMKLDSKLTFENFVVGKPNELAYAAAIRIAEADSVAYNPLFLYGGVGLGKTHLMHSIAWKIRERSPSRNIAYMSAEKFMYYFIRSVRYKDTMSFKEQFRAVDVLMIDDIQFICGKDSTQEEFFHTFNALVDNNRQVIVSADKSPSDLEGMEDRLRSRLGWGLVADIHPTNYELRLGILHSKVALSKTKVPDKVLEFVAHKITSNVRELEGALNRIIANAMFVGREITIDSAQDVLVDLLRVSDRRVSVEDIQKKVAQHFSIRVSDMSSNRRMRQITYPRQVAMYLSKKLTTLSLPEIGKNFGGRDHTTVIHAIKKIEADMSINQSVSEDIHLLTKILAK